MTATNDRPLLPGDAHLGEDPESADSDASAFLGQEVEVVLSYGDEQEPSVIARGTLLAWDDFGECHLLDEMGAVHHCWPMLSIRPVGGSPVAKQLVETPAGELAHYWSQVIKLTDEVSRLRAAILDIDAHATPYGEDKDGFVDGGYLVSVGALHRALGVVGYSARKCPTCPHPHGEQSDDDRTAR